MSQETKNREIVIILHNPKSGARHATELIDGLFSKLHERGFEAESFSNLNDFENRVAYLCKQNDPNKSKLRAVIAAGGDGTASAVASRINSDVPLRIFPLGTENLLASYFGYKQDITCTLESIERLDTKKIDAATANGKLFLIVAGIGFDADVVRRLHTNRKGHIRRWHYWWHILASTFCYRFPALRIVDLSTSSNSESTKSPSEECSISRVACHPQVAWVFVQNFPCYADRLCIANESSEDDGYLNVSSFERGGFLTGMKYLTWLRMGWHRNLSDFRSSLLPHFRVEEVVDIKAKKLTPKDSPKSEIESTASFQIDGDWGGPLPVEFQILPRRVTIVL